MRTEASAEVAELWSSDVTDSFLIIACDGIFEEISNKQAAALARAAFQKYGVDDVGAVAKAIIEWVMLKGGTDNMTCVIKVLDKDSFKKLDSRTVGSECEACGLAYPAVLNAGAVLRTTARDVRHLDEPGLQRYLKDVGLYAPKVADCVEIKVLRRGRAESSRRPPRHRRLFLMVDSHTGRGTGDGRHRPAGRGLDFRRPGSI